MARVSERTMRLAQGPTLSQTTRSHPQVRWPVPAILLTAIATVPLGIYGEWAFARAGATTIAIVSDLTVGWTFVAAGLVAWRRQPSSWSGLLMAVEGFAWFLTDLQGSGTPALVLIGTLLGAVNEAVLVHLVLTLPTGRTSSRHERWLISIAYGLALAGGLAYLESAGPPWNPYRCQVCTTDLILPPTVHMVLAAGQRAIEVMGTALGIAVVAVVCRRWVDASAAERRLLAPLWLSLGICGVLSGSHLLAALQIRPTAVTQAFLDISDTVELAVPFGFLLVALRLRITRAALSELVLERGTELSLEQLATELAHALGDPSVELGVWDVTSDTYRDPSGRPIRPPIPPDRRMATRIEGAGQPVAIVLHDRVLADDQGLVRTISAALRLVAERGLLVDHLKHQVEEVRQSRARISKAGDAARRQLERDLHDGAQRRFVLVSMTLASTLRWIKQTPGAPDLEGRLAVAADELRNGLIELRDLARGLHPAVVSERGLPGAIESLVGRMPVPVEVAADGHRFPPPIELTAYYVLSEALTNVARHARASHVRVSAQRARDHLVVEVTDDGVGGACPDSGSGLQGIADRVATHGGTLALDSPPGEGTRLRAELPCG